MKNTTIADVYNFIFNSEHSRTLEDDHVIASKLGMSTKSVQRSLKELQKNKHIIVLHVEAGSREVVALDPTKDNSGITSNYVEMIKLILPSRRGNKKLLAQLAILEGTDITEVIDYYVYTATLSGEVVYIGKGKGDRYKHLTSGKSHCYFANEQYYRNKLLGEELHVVSIVNHFDNEEDAIEAEELMIQTCAPKWNIEFNRNK